MKKDFSKLILPLLLVLALGYAFLSFLPTPQAKKEVQTSTTLTPRPTPTPSPKTVETPKPREAILADPFAMRTQIRRKVEVTASPTNEVKPADPIKLMGILKNEGTSIAIISGQSVTVGSAIRGWRVVSILEDRVVLQHGNTVKILKMEEK